MFAIEYIPEAMEDLQRLKKSEPAAFKKAVKLINELMDHPKTGTGHPEPLKGKPGNRWSRQITKNIDSSIAYLKQKSSYLSYLHMVITTINISNN